MTSNKRTHRKIPRLNELGEFGLISHLRMKSKSHRKDIATGIGDDAAVIRSPKGNLLVTSDMMIEGIHFDLSFTTFYQLGYKFLAVNMSDIFAMGGKADHFFISLGIPGNFSFDWIDDLYSGMLDLAKDHHVAIAGGDTCTSKTGFTLSGTLIGHAKKAVTRAGARTGDALYVKGALGDSSMGLNLLRKGGRRVRDLSSESARLQLIKSHLMPRISPLKTTQRISSMIDISDGLLIDISHICDESGVGVEIFKEDIPLSEELVHYANKFREDPLFYALKGGEDYSLLFTAPQDSRVKAKKIGNIIKRGRYIVDECGKRTRFRAEGYEHFRKGAKPA